MQETGVDDYWIQVATDLAATAMIEGEVPIASLVVAGGSELSRAVTEVHRVGSIVAHGEVAALRNAGNEIGQAERPLVVYTNLEPCLMCVGAALQAGVDEVVYAMRAPDGAAKTAALLNSAGELSVVVRMAGDESASRSRFEEYVRRWPDAPGATYVRRLLAFASEQRQSSEASHRSLGGAVDPAG